MTTTDPREAAKYAIGQGEVSTIEAMLLKWQWKLLTGSFEVALWAALEVADDSNLNKLALGFPDEVNAIKLYRTTWIAQSLRDRGLL